jgi:hypothetical protein
MVVAVAWAIGAEGTEEITNHQSPKGGNHQSSIIKSSIEVSGRMTALALASTNRARAVFSAKTPQLASAVLPLQAVRLVIGRLMIDDFSRKTVFIRPPSWSALRALHRPAG